MKYTGMSCLGVVIVSILNWLDIVFFCRGLIIKNEYVDGMWVVLVK